MTPSFYDPKRIADVYIERAGEIAAAAHAAKKIPAKNDTTRICFFGIDVQIGFCTPGASLFVPGAVEDTRRAIELIYRKLDRITTLVFSLDTHEVHQIFHAAWWEDKDGNPPASFTSITAASVKSGQWRARRFPEQSLEYVEKLEREGKYVLTIWPYHALLGGTSHALVPAMMECALYHELLRDQPMRLEIKGRHAKTENYSVLSPEVRELKGENVGALNQSLLDVLRAHDRVYVFGQAKSHCVLSTLTDIERNDPELLKKVWALEDAMSSVPPPPLDPLPAALDFPTIANDQFAKLAAKGMHVVKTTDEW
jgi:nicotinamidase-related amidase